MIEHNYNYNRIDKYEHTDREIKECILLVDFSNQLLIY